MGGIAKANRAGRDASGRTSRYLLLRRDRPVCGDPGIRTSLGLEVSTINAGDPREMDRAVTAFAREPNGGLIVTAAPSTVVHRDLIVALAARHKLPTVYFDRTPVAGGGLISYGPDLVSQFQQAASYVDRILRGEKPANLPVQAPNKYELVINLKTAKALGLIIPPDFARTRRRGDRITILFAATHKSASGT